MTRRIRFALVASGLALLQASPALAHEGADSGAAHQLGLLLALASFGLIALVQPLLAARLKPLDRRIGQDRVYRVHRYVGLTAACLLSLHPMLIFGSPDITVGPARAAIWPVFLGAATLFGLWAMVGASWFRAFLGIPYHVWRLAHRAGAACLILMAMVHLNAIEGEPFGLLSALAMAPVVLVVGGVYVWRFLLVPARLAAAPWRVEWVRPAGRDAHEVALVPPGGRVPEFAPGQFAFLTFLSAGLPREEHPWTISSPPEESERLRFTIRCSGDFTARIGRVAAGDKALVEAPFGRFSNRLQGVPSERELVFVAGGIGITPMLSMLRSMALAGEDDGVRRVRLIWANRSPGDVLFPEEWEELAARLPGLSVKHVFTREARPGEQPGRLDGNLLSRLLADAPRTAEVFLCGPPAFMDSVELDLRRLGYAAGRIHTERFSLSGRG